LLNSTHLIPSIETPVRDLYLATTAQIYPALTNGESVSRHARQAAEVVTASRQQEHERISDYQSTLTLEGTDGR